MNELLIEFAFLTVFFVPLFLWIKITKNIYFYVVLLVVAFILLYLGWGYNYHLNTYQHAVMLNIVEAGNEYKVAFYQLGKNLALCAIFILISRIYNTIKYPRKSEWEIDRIKKDKKENELREAKLAYEAARKRTIDENIKIYKSKIRK